MPAIFPDSIEVLVYNSEAGPVLVAAVELISPANKDRAASSKPERSPAITDMKRYAAFCEAPRHQALPSEILRLLLIESIELQRFRRFF